MTKFLVYSDMHIYGFDEFCRAVENDGTRRLRAQLATAEWIVDLARSLKVDQVVDLGDNVLTLGFIDSLTQTWMARIFSVLDAVNPVRLLGNHDIMSKSGLVNSVEFSKNLVRKAELRDGVLFLPYTVQEDGGQSIIEEFQPNLIFTHNNVDGAYYTSERAGRGGIQPTALGHALLVGGHLHMPQVLMPGVVLVGSCMYASFKDHMLANLPRGAVLLEYNEKYPVSSTVRWIENPHTPIFNTFDHLSASDFEKFCNLYADKLPRLYARVLTDEKTLPELEPYLRQFAGLRLQVDKATKKLAVPAADLTNASVLEQLVPAELKEDVLALYRAHADKLDYTVNAKLVIRSLRIRDFMSWESLDLNFDEPGLYVVDGENGAGKCIPEGTPVCLWGGGWKPVEAIRETDLLVGLDPRTWTLRPEHPEVIATSGVQEVYQLRTRRGFAVQATAHHPVLTPGGWKPLGSLSVGDPVAVPKFLPIPESGGPSFEAGVLLGMLLGDGSFRGRGCVFTNSNPEVVALFRKALAAVPELSKVTLRESVQKNPTTNVTTVSYSFREGRRGARRPGYQRWLEKYGLLGTASRSKFIPADFFTGRPGALGMLLGLLVTDGYVTEDGHAEFAVVSRQLAEGVRSLFLRFGVPVSLRVDKEQVQTVSVLAEGRSWVQEHVLPLFPPSRIRPGTGKRARSCWRAVPPEAVAALVQEAKAKGLPLRELAAWQRGGWMSAENWEKQVARIKPCREVARFGSGDLVWDAVESVEPCGSKQTWDIQMPSQAFFAQDFLVHNTAIWEALCWGLFGEAARKLERMDSITRRGATTGTEVTVVLEKDGYEYGISRYWNHAQHKNAVKYYLDGVDQTQRLPSETARRIKRILGFDKDWFLRMVYAHGPEMHRSRFSVLTESGRAQFIESISGVHVFRSAEEEVNKRLGGLRKEFDKLRIRVEEGARALAQLEADTEANKEALRANVATIESQRAALLAQREKHGKEVEECDNRVAELREAFSYRGAQILGLSGQIEEAVRQVQDLKGKLQSLDEASLKNQVRLQQLQAQYQTLSKEMAVAKHRFTDLQCIEEGQPCPTCGNVGVSGAVREQLLERIPAQLAALADALAQCQQGQEALLTEQEGLKKRRDELNQCREAALQNQRAWEAERAGLQAQQNQATAELNRANLAREQAQKSVRSVEEALARVEESAQLLDSQLLALDQQVEQRREELRQLETRVEEQSRELEHQQAVGECLASLRRRSYLATIDRINANLPVYSEIMSGGKYSVRIDSVSDKGEEKVVFRVNDSTALYHTLSTGQKARVDLAVQAAQSELLDCNLVVFDECDWGLDPQGAAALLELVEHLGKKKRVFMTSHSEHLRRGSERVWTVVLENERSRLL